ncbi:MAG: hypothetical protein JWL98_1968 [Xanthomonadaceae bacterium]|nr:hypothetical protein [Xanthomonadaceae bacterium]
MPTRYYLSLPDPQRARGSDPDVAFRAHGADAFAEELQQALRSDALFERWRARQPEPDAIDASLAVTDPAAVVIGKQKDLRIDLVATTTIPGSVLKQRMRVLAGSGWTLTDVTAA